MTDTAILAPVAGESAAPSSAPTTPAAPPAPDMSAWSLEDKAIHAAVQEAMKQEATPAAPAAPTDAAAPDATPAPVVDANGKLRDPVTGQFVSDKPKVEGEEVAAPAKPQPVTKFAVTKDGAPVEFDPAAVITYKRGGEDITEPLDRVVRRAQMSFAVEQREQLAQQATGEAAALKARVEAYEQQQAALQKDLLTLAQNPDLFPQFAEQLLADHTPEKQLERERAKLESERTAFQRQQVAQQEQAFYASTIAPAVQQFAETKLTYVTPQEFETYVYRALEPLARSGPMTEQRASEIFASIKSAAEYAEALDFQRQTHFESKLKTREQQVAAAARQQVKNTDARGLTPVAPTGTAPNVAPPPVPTRQINNSADAVDAAVEAALAATLAR